MMVVTAVTVVTLVTVVTEVIVVTTIYCYYKTYKNKNKWDKKRKKICCKEKKIVTEVLRHFFAFQLFCMKNYVIRFSMMEQISGITDFFMLKLFMKYIYARKIFFAYSFVR